MTVPLEEKKDLVNELEKVVCEDEDDEVEFDDEEDNTEIIRCKWQGDGAKTLEELIEKMQEFIGEIRLLQEKGWELVSPMSDDYGFIAKKA